MAKDKQAEKVEEGPKPAWNPSTMGPLDPDQAEAYDVQPAPGAEPEEKEVPKTDAQQAAKQGKS